MDRSTPRRQPAIFAPRCFKLHPLSAHADQRDLLEFAAEVRARGPLSHVALVHGDPQPQKLLAGLLAEQGMSRVSMPAPGERLTL